MGIKTYKDENMEWEVSKQHVKVSYRFRSMLDSSISVNSIKVYGGNNGDFDNRNISISTNRDDNLSAGYFNSRCGAQMKFGIAKRYEEEGLPALKVKLDEVMEIFKKPLVIA